MALPPTPAEPQTPAASETPETNQAPEAQAQEQPQVEQTFVTKEQLDQAVAEAVRNVKMADKQRAKQIRQEVETIKKRLDEAGMTYTPQQLEKLEDEIIAQYSDDDEESDGSPASQQQPAPGGDIPAEILPALSWMKKQGVIVNDSDPEFAEHLKPVLDTPKLDQVEISLAMAKAVEAKRARMALQQGKAPLRTPASGGAPATETFTPKDARDLWKRAHK